jgi:hypothetical protein
MKRIVILLWFVSMAILVFASTAMAQSTDRVQLAFIVDGSGSIDSGEFSVMRNGIADALQNNSCVPQDGRLELTVIQFSSDARVEVSPTIITTSNVGTIASQIRNMSQLGNSTNYESAIDLAVAQVQGSPNFSSFDRQVINFTTDGEPNLGVLDMPVLRQRAINAGFEELDAEGIGLSSSSTNENDVSGVGISSIAVLEQLVFPQPASVHPPLPWPPTSGGWVRVVDDVNAFASTVCQKFQVTVNPGPTPTPVPPPDIPEPITLVLFGMGSAAVGLYANRKRKNNQQQIGE